MRTTTKWRPWQLNHDAILATGNTRTSGAVARTQPRQPRTWVNVAYLQARAKRMHLNNGHGHSLQSAAEQAGRQTGRQSRAEGEMGRTRGYLSPSSKRFGQLVLAHKQSVSVPGAAHENQTLFAGSKKA